MNLKIQLEVKGISYKTPRRLKVCLFLLIRLISAALSVNSVKRTKV